MSEDDRAWARSLASGDKQAFGVLVERETTRVFRTCYRVLRRVDEAEEATQETFVLAYRALGTFRGDGDPAAWLLRIATRESWRLAAARARRQPISLVFDDAVVTMPASGADPSEQAIAAQEGEQLRRAVSELPEPYREVITLRYLGELSLKEIGAATGRPAGTIKAQIHRGMNRLRESMDGTAR